MILTNWWRPYQLSPRDIQQCNQIVFEYYLSRKLLKIVKLLVRKDCCCAERVITSAQCRDCMWMSNTTWVSPALLKHYLPQALCCVDESSIHQKVAKEVELLDRDLLNKLCCKSFVTRKRADELCKKIMSFFSNVPCIKSEAQQKLMLSIHNVCDQATRCKRRRT